MSHFEPKYDKKKRSLRDRLGLDDYDFSQYPIRHALLVLAVLFPIAASVYYCFPHPAGAIIWNTFTLFFTAMGAFICFKLAMWYIGVFQAIRSGPQPADNTAEAHPYRSPTLFLMTAIFATIFLRILHWVATTGSFPMSFMLQIALVMILTGLLAAWPVEYFLSWYDEHKPQRAKSWWPDPFALGVLGATPTLTMTLYFIWKTPYRIRPMTHSEYPAVPNPHAAPSDVWFIPTEINYAFVYIILGAFLICWAVALPALSRIATSVVSGVANTRQQERLADEQHREVEKRYKRWIEAGGDYEQDILISKRPEIMGCAFLLLAVVCSVYASVLSTLIFSALLTGLWFLWFKWWPMRQKRD